MTDPNPVRPAAPRANHRLGPRPLLLHLMLAMRTWENQPAGPPSSGASAPAGCPRPAGPGNIAGLSVDARLVAGIAAYRRHPGERTLADPPVIWAEGGSRLLDYGRAEASPVLFVPSLVNRAHVLDLMEGASMLRYLSAGGVRPLLLDWGDPDAAERRFTLTDYIAGRLERAIVAVGRPVTLAGYCMGGLMAVASALRRPDLVQRLALLATPWDFWSPNRAAATAVAAFGVACEPALMLAGALPVDALQTLFALAEPGGVAVKYREFASLDQQSERAHRFVALEDWLNDGVPLAAPVAREILDGWYGANSPALGAWRVAGAPVRPEALRTEIFIALPARDRIVPPESAMALARCLPQAVVHRPQAGHVGMIAGSNARAELWTPLLNWLRG